MPSTALKQAGAADLEILQELNRNYVRSAEQSDVHWYGENLAEDFVSSNPDGSFVDRAGFLARMARPYPGSDLAAEDVRIRIVGDVALIHAGFRCRRTDGQQATGRYTDIWARRQGRWLCIAAHFSLFSNEQETLRELNRNYIRSVRESDLRWFEANLAEDFMNSNPDGTLVDRAGFLKQIAPPCPVANLEAEDVRIRIIGETAIIHARTTYAKPGGAAGAGRYTDVWARQQGRWLCVSAHVSRG